MLSVHRLFDLPSQYLFHSGGVRCIKDAFLFQKVFKRGASIGIFGHGFHTPFCAYLLTLSPVVSLLSLFNKTVQQNHFTTANMKNYTHNSPIGDMTAYFPEITISF